MKGMDSNIIVYALNQDLPEHSECRNLLKNIAEGKETISIPSIVLMESYHALVNAYKYDGSEVKKRLISIIDSENINVLEISVSTILLAFEIADEYKTGGRDSLIAASLLEYDIKKIYSHDKDFDKIKRLKRIDPVKSG
ncbi:MAG: PIN domain-containing protein [Promethearchaeota archaeon]|nr:MAG: PIN domain-containing protein [Candidatus Lokiarchaeota archaeon]